MFQNSSVMNKNQLKGKSVKITVVNENKEKNYSLGNNHESKQGGVSDELISISDLKLKLNQIIYDTLNLEYGNTLLSSSSLNTQFFDLFQNSNNFENIISNYSQTLLEIVKEMEQNRLKHQSKHRTLIFNNEERTKLKLILSDSEEKELNQLKSKGIESYVKKIEDECEKHKREYIMMKERNKFMENEMLKISLEFKNKRELYITEIARLTEILHSSFLEVGKMFANMANSNSELKNYDDLQYQQLESNKMQIPNYQRDKITTNQQDQSNFLRKNVKSLSPKRQVQSHLKNEMKLFDFIPETKKSETISKNESKQSQPKIYISQINESKNLYFDRKKIQ